MKINSWGAGWGEILYITVLWLSKVQPYLTKSDILVFTFSRQEEFKFNVTFLLGEGMIMKNRLS